MAADSLIRKKVYRLQSEQRKLWLVSSSSSGSDQQTTKTCGMMLEPRRFLPRSIATRLEFVREPDQVQQVDSPVKSSPNKNKKKRARNKELLKEAKRDKRIRESEWKSISQAALGHWWETISFLQQLHGVFYGGQVQVQAHLHEVWGSPRYGRQSLIVFLFFVVRFGYWDEWVGDQPNDSFSAVHLGLQMLKTSHSFRHHTALPANSGSSDHQKPATMRKSKSTKIQNPLRSQRTRPNKSKTVSKDAPLKPSFLENFAGQAGLYNPYTDFSSDRIEVNEDVFQSVDLLDPAVLSHVKFLISEGWILGIHFGTPCSSFSKARKNDGGPPPPWCSLKLKGLDLENVKLGNCFLDITVQLATCCHDHAVPWSMENPDGSFLWLMPPMVTLTKKCKAVRIELDIWIAIHEAHSHSRHL